MPLKQPINSLGMPRWHRRRIHFIPSSMIDIGISIILLFILFPVKFKFLPLDTSRLAYFTLFMLFFIGLKRIKIDKSFVYISALIVIVSAFTLVYNSSIDIVFLRISLEIVLRNVVMASLLAYLLFVYLEGDYFRFIKILINTFIIQALFIVIMLLSPQIQELIQAVIDSKAKDGNEFWRLRQVGVTGWAAYDMAINMSIPMFLFPILLSKIDVYSTRLKSFYVLGVLFVSALISGRTTFVAVFFLYFSVILIYFLKIHGGQNVHKTYMTFLCVFLIFVICFVTISLSFFDVKELEFFLEWAFEFFLNLLSGSAETDSTNELAKMYYIPADSALFIGDGRYVAKGGGFYGGTDVGYLRLVLYFGAIGSLVFYTFYAVFFLRLAFLLRKVVRPMFYFVLSLGALFFLVNFKGSIFVDASPGIFALFLVYYFFVYWRSENVKKN